jgi:hypothetical protein
MTIYLKRAMSHNHRLDLLDWNRERELRLTNPVARRIAQRFCLPIHHADSDCPARRIRGAILMTRPVSLTIRAHIADIEGQVTVRGQSEDTPGNDKISVDGVCHV